MIEAGLYKAKAVETGSYTNLKIGDYVEGYYVKCRNTHYILQQYNDMGYDERWEAHEWIEVDIKTLEMISPAASPVSDAVEFLDSIRAYERENGQRICNDERTSQELYEIFKPTTPTNVQEQDEDEEDVLSIISSNLYNIRSSNESPMMDTGKCEEIAAFILSDLKSTHTITKKK